MKKKMMVTIVIVITMALSLMTGCSNPANVQEEIPSEEPTIETEKEEVEIVSPQHEMFEPLMIKVEKLPEWLTEADLENGFISTHKLMEIAKSMGKDLELETDGKVYTIKSNMVAHNSIETVAVKEDTEEVEAPEEVTEEPKEEMPQASEPSTPAQPVPPTPSEPSTPDQQTPVQPSTPAQPSEPAEQVPVHEHVWEPIYETIHHEAEGHYETVVIQEAWDEVVEEVEWHTVCNTCGVIIEGWSEQAISDHTYQHAIAGQPSGWGDRQVVVGTSTIHHDAVTEQRWVEDKAAYDETITTGYRCSSCGAQK